MSDLASIERKLEDIKFALWMLVAAVLSLAMGWTMTRNQPTGGITPPAASSCTVNVAVTPEPRPVTLEPTP